MNTGTYIELCAMKSEHVLYIPVYSCATLEDITQFRLQYLTIRCFMAKKVGHKENVATGFKTNKVEWSR